MAAAAASTEGKSKKQREAEEYLSKLKLKEVFQVSEVSLCRGMSITVTIVHCRDY